MILMFLYYLDSGFFKPGRKSETLCSRVLKLCEKESPSAVLIHGEILYPEGFQRFTRTLQALRIACITTQESFEATDSYQTFCGLSAEARAELREPAADTLYKIHKNDSELTRIYMQLFVRHSITDDPDFLAELEKRIQGMGKENKAGCIKQKMN